MDVTLFHNSADVTNSATLIPVVFPLLAGAAAFTTLLSFRSQFSNTTIIAAIVANMVWVYIVFKLALKAENTFSGSLIFVLRRFFGIILLAVSIRLFTSNLFPLIESFRQGAGQ